VLLVVGAFLDACKMAVFLAHATGSFAALCNTSGLLLFFGGSDHTQATVGACSEGTVVVGAAARLFFNFSVFNGQLALGPFSGCGVVVQVLAVVNIERAVTDSLS
jgi:hypothetical protein